jgi:hypothetical protein
MSLFLGDIRIKTMLELGLADISKNAWLLNDILGDTVSNPYLRQRYGSQIESCKQWLANNRINLFLSEQQADKMEFPAITIEIGASNEKADLKHMGDLSYASIKLIPNNINKPIPYVLKPTTGSYDFDTGVYTFSPDVALTQVAPGMILVDPTNGLGYPIQSITNPNQVNLEINLNITATTIGIIPKYQFYESRIGHTFMTEPYKITCHGMDQQTLLWLHSIAVYSLLRYRQVLLEKDGYAESMISSGKIYANPDYSDAGQVIWSRDINITGQVENRWIMQPHRFIEDIQMGTGGGITGKEDIQMGTGGGITGKDDVFIGGIKIISNITDTFENLNTVNWSTIMDAALDSEANE